MKNNGQLGMAKHRKSGKIAKNPKIMLRMKLDAEKNEKKRKTYEMFSNIKELFNK